VSADAEPLTIAIGESERVSALLQVPGSARACYVMAHGAGAGMRHAFMTDLARALAGQGIATLRFQFPYMEQGSKRTDSPVVAHAAVRAAVAAAARLVPGALLLAGGKSFGGRMTSQAQAATPLPGVRGLVFVGFPLHPSGKPSTDRARHLSAIELPMLFLQGTRDLLADMALVRGVTATLGARATLELVVDADHAFHVPARSGRGDASVIDGLSTVIARWSRAVVLGQTDNPATNQA
jgi:predicted alpha/beta-hydrolase family hydrolase